MPTPLLEHIDTAIKDLNDLKRAESDETLKKELNENDRKRFLKIFLTKAQQQLGMIELYLK